MTKTGKFLYGGFAIVALAGIVAMLVSIFSSPKQQVGKQGFCDELAANVL